MGHPYREPASRGAGQRWGATPAARAYVRWLRTKLVVQWMMLDAVDMVVCRACAHRAVSDLLGAIAARYR